jgi:hypothetical protein
MIGTSSKSLRIKGLSSDARYTRGGETTGYRVITDSEAKILKTGR